MKPPEKSLFEQWFEVYWLQKTDFFEAGSKTKQGVAFMDELVHSLLHVLLITGEEELQGHVNSIH